MVAGKCEYVLLLIEIEYASIAPLFNLVTVERMRESAVECMLAEQELDIWQSLMGERHE